MSDGPEIVEVVLDVVPVHEDGQHYERVIVRGVYPRNAHKPDLLEGATRNVVQVFMGITMDIKALLIASRA
jgi:hypothetical protein